MRHILAASLLFLAGALCAFPAVDPALLAMVPPGAKFVAGVHLNQARSSQFGQFLLSRIHSDDGHFHQFAEETGFDPRRDLDEFVFAAGTSNGKAENFAILARGNFDETRIKAQAKKNGAVAENYKGVSLFSDKNGERHGTAFAFLDGGIAMMGDRATLRQIIDARDTPSAMDPTLQEDVVKASADNDAWFASSMAGSYVTKHFGREMNESAERAQALQSITRASGGIRLGNLVQFSFDAQTRSAQDATSLADVFRFGGSMVQMQRQSDPRAGILAAAVDKMKLETNGASLHATFSLLEKDLEQLAALQPNRHPDQGR